MRNRVCNVLGKIHCIELGDVRKKVTGKQKETTKQTKLLDNRELSVLASETLLVKCYGLGSRLLAFGR